MVGSISLSKRMAQFDVSATFRSLLMVFRGVFDMTNPMASIASHLTYWSDEDVSHFMISQLLSRQRVVKR